MSQRGGYNGARYPWWTNDSSTQADPIVVMTADTGFSQANFGSDDNYEDGAIPLTRQLVFSHPCCWSP